MHDASEWQEFMFLSAQIPSENWALLTQLSACMVLVTSFSQQKEQALEQSTELKKKKKDYQRLSFFKKPVASFPDTPLCS